MFYRHAFAEPLVDDNQASSKKTTLANLLPGVSRQAHLVISGNEYLNVSHPALGYVEWHWLI